MYTNTTLNNDTIPTNLTLDTTMLNELYTEYDKLLNIYEEWCAEPAATARGLQVVRTRLAYLKHQITIRGGVL